MVLCGWDFIFPSPLSPFQSITDHEGRFILYTAPFEQSNGNNSNEGDLASYYVLSYQNPNSDGTSNKFRAGASSIEFNTQTSLLTITLHEEIDIELELYVGEKKPSSGLLSYYYYLPDRDTHIGGFSNAGSLRSIDDFIFLDKAIPNFTAFGFYISNDSDEFPYGTPLTEIYGENYSSSIMFTPTPDMKSGQRYRLDFANPDKPILIE